MNQENIDSVHEETAGQRTAEDSSGYEESFRRRKAYNRRKIWLGLANFFVGLAFLIVLVASPLSRFFADRAADIWGHPYGSLLFFALFVGIAESVITFPISFYTGFFLEHKYDLTDQSLGSYFWEKGKGMLVGAAIGIPILLLFYYFLRTYGNGWWLPTAVLMFVVTVVLSRIAPKIIMPLFYDFDPIDRKDLKTRIKGLADQVGLSIEGIFQFNLSKETKKANAAFTGIGKAKRVIVGDTLLENFTDDEILSVIAHELGHYTKKHLWKLSAVGTAFTFIGLFLVSRIYAYVVSATIYEDITSLAALPIITLFLVVFNFVIGPVQNAISRHFERQADDFSVTLFRQPEITIQALEKLADQNLADPAPHPVVEFLFYSHPSIPNRVRRIRNRYLG